MFLRTTLIAVLLSFPANGPLQGEGDEASSLAWGDFDGDQLPDVYVSAPDGSDRLLRNLGGGSFEPVALPDGEKGSRFARWQDIDGDGDVDLYVSTDPGPGRILANLGGGLFEPVVDGIPAGLELGEVVRASWFDFDRDGAPDLFLVGTVASSLLHNRGDGTLTAVEIELAGEALPTATLPAGTMADEAEPTADEAPRPVTAPRRGTRVPVPVDVAFGGLPVNTPSPLGGGGGVMGVTQGGAMPLTGGTLCAKSIQDQANPSACLSASSTPGVGKLYLMSSSLYVSPTTGRVGINTTNPLAMLFVNGDMISTGDLSIGESIRIGGGFFTGISSPVSGELRFLGGGADRIRVTATGDVGIGTTSPSSKLDVAGPIEGTELRTGFGTTTVPSIRFGLGEGAGLSSPTPETLSLLTNFAERLRITSLGYVGIGTTAPSNKLEVVGTGTGTSGATVRVRNTTTGAGIAIYATTDGTDGTMVLTQTGSGSIVRAFNGGGSPVFEVRNSGRCVTTALQITGGGDLVEGFDAGESMEPGTVLCIDPERPGKLMPARQAYDTRVAGVVSGANGINHGIRMGQDGVLDGDTLVAMAGRVYVRCTLENGAIVPGDLLTTSSLVGHAMKATDKERAFGAVIGKAMSSLDESTGLVLVLVSLQ